MFGTKLAESEETLAVLGVVLALIALLGLLSLGFHGFVEFSGRDTFGSISVCIDRPESDILETDLSPSWN